MYIVLEYVGGGTLQGLIEHAPDGIIPRRQVQQIFRQLLLAVEYIHSRNIVHCDIKPDNLMFTSDGVLKMTDFGVAEEMGGLDNDYEILTKSGGSPAFQPPEVKSGSSNLFSPAKIDIWAVGITLYIMVHGKYPFSGTNIYTICENISKGEYLIPDTTEPELAALIRGILQINPSDRMSVQDMKTNSWVVTDIPIDPKPPIPYVNGDVIGTPHNIFAQNYRASYGQGLHSSTEEYDEEPTVFTQDESEENSTYSSGMTQNHTNKTRPSNSGASSLSQSTNTLTHSTNALPSTSLTSTVTSITTNTTNSISPGKSRRSKVHCAVM